MSAHCTARERMGRLRSAITNAPKQLHYLQMNAETPPESWVTTSTHHHCHSPYYSQKIQSLCMLWRYTREQRCSSTNSQTLPRYPLNMVGASRQSNHISSNVQLVPCSLHRVRCPGSFLSRVTGRNVTCHLCSRCSNGTALLQCTDIWPCNSWPARWTNVNVMRLYTSHVSYVVLPFWCIKCIEFWLSKSAVPKVCSADPWDPRPVPSGSVDTFL